jgi:hypothetical protein
MAHAFTLSYTTQGTDSVLCERVQGTNTCPAHFILLHWVTCLVSSINHEARLNAVFSSLLLLPPTQAQYFPQHTLLQDPQSMYYP